jgi:succinylarginine dihydrolase
VIKEIQLDGLIGPTHFFGGLAHGNVASEANLGKVSHPRAAALQGLKKMKCVYDCGVMQLVMPPHPRPAVRFLENIGFSGSLESKIHDVVRDVPDLLPIIYSSSAMWAANAATTCASVDSGDGKVHITPANLISNAHRALEAAFTAPLLKRIFSGDAFSHHAPLPYNPMLSDEGAANHMRLVSKSGKVVHVFVYGAGGSAQSKKFTARQHIQASRMIARTHRLNADYVLFLQQHPDAIDAGVFHNDVIATSNDNVLIYHERAFVDDAPLRDALANAGGFEIIRISEVELSLDEVVKSYLFNSQIITKPDGTMVLIAPRECEASDAARVLIQRIIAAPQNPIASVQYIDVGQSMGNGGGPACLRLRLWLNEAEWRGIHRGIIFSDALFERLGNWVNTYYPEQLNGDSLRDVELPARVKKMLLDLEKIMELEGLYDGWF